MKHLFFIVRNLFVVFILLTGNTVFAGIGIYGVSIADTRLKTLNEIDTVFVPTDAALIKTYRSAGKKVLLSFNVFGGRGPWEKWPESIPVTADGQKLSDSYSGICPGFERWHKERLAALTELVEKFGDNDGIDGIWLDFIRYPGRWENADPHVPDTCWCDCCVKKFAKAKNIALPEDVTQTAEKAAWIKSHAFDEWHAWKKSRITDFVRDARQILDQNPHGKKLRLGVFLVPWRKSDHNGAVTFSLAQDPTLFSPYVDVYSPMLYHKMVGQPTKWVYETSVYFREMVNGELWPIIQAEDISAAGLSSVVEAVADSGATGLLVYAYRHIQDAHWDVLTRFRPRQNLIADPDFTGFAADNQFALDEEKSAQTWHKGEGKPLKDSRFYISETDTIAYPALGITAGRDRQGVVSTPLPQCIPGQWYLFDADFYRDDRQNPHAYPEVQIWGQSFRLNTHRMTGKFQNLHARLRCPEDGGKTAARFVFRNPALGETLWMRRPKLVHCSGWAAPETDIQPSRPFWSDFFPLGVYGASHENLDTLKALGLNTAVLGFNEDNINACIKHKLHCTLSVPRNPEKLLPLLDRLTPLLHQGDFAFYVNDEPGIHSFPVWKAEDIQCILKQRFPENYTNMAIVRPQAVFAYRNSADFFMLDQYPVPHNPMTWLSDAMDQAARAVGRNRLQSVVQAFGGEKWAAAGWPRLPTFDEMNNLAFLSLIHGSRGIYFYSLSRIAQSEKGAEDLRKVVERLNVIMPWLTNAQAFTPLAVTMTGRYRFSPDGQPGVHCALKTMRKENVLLCANTLHTYTRAQVPVAGNGKSGWKALFTSGREMSVDGRLDLSFDPLEVKAFWAAP